MVYQVLSHARVGAIDTKGTGSYGVTVIGTLSSPFSPRDFAALAASRAGSRPTKMVATAQTAQAMRAKKKVSFIPIVIACCPGIIPWRREGTQEYLSLSPGRTSG